MSANNSGVRNLRAMFENKTTDPATSTSPPSRGRSPADSEASLHSRPVSKVRASFVAVERPGEAGQGQQWGLRKASDVGMMAEMNKEQLDGTALSKTAQDREPANPVERPLADETTNGTGGSARSEGVKATPNKPAEVDGGLGAILKGSPFESLPSDTANAGTVRQNNPSTRSKPVAKPAPASQSASLATRMKDARKDPPPKGNFIASKNAISVLPADGRIRPPVSTKSPTTLKGPPQKSPISPNAQNKAASPKAAKPEESGKPTSKTSIRSPTLPKPEPRSLPSSGPKETEPVKTKASDGVSTSNGVKKDTSPTSARNKARPQSPTRPVRLPAAAKASTTATVVKTSSVSNRPASRASITATATERNVATSQHNKSTAKPPTLATAPSLAKKASRASLASQPGGHDIPKSRTSNVVKAPAEGFLARMTRPTASFAQKTHEKLQVHSPPRERKSIAKPKLRKGTGKSEDDKENVVDTNGIENYGAEDLAPGTDDAVEQAQQQGGVSAQPLAAGHQDAESTQQTH